MDTTDVTEANSRTAAYCKCKEKMKNCRNLVSSTIQLRDLNLFLSNTYKRFIPNYFLFTIT